MGAATLSSSRLPAEALGELRVEGLEIGEDAVQQRRVAQPDGRIDDVEGGTDGLGLAAEIAVADDVGGREGSQRRSA